MRTISQSRDHFHGTHKGADINIERETGPGIGGFEWYIRVRFNDGFLYDGWPPETVRTLAQAKAEARRGAMLDEPA